MAWLHTWSGLLPGWLLFVIFLFGTTAFFQYEITRWMMPERGGGAVTSVGLDEAESLLARKASGAEEWGLFLPPDRGGDPIFLSWKFAGKGDKRSGFAQVEPDTGREVESRKTDGGWFLYRFHFDLRYIPFGWARYLVCIAALAMLVAILSGIVTHKKIFADFFLLRFGKGQRSWLDAHNVTAVLALPFHLMITYTGLVTLLFALMPWAIDANYTDQDAFNDELWPHIHATGEAGQPLPGMPLRFLTDKATNLWGGAQVRSISISNPGTRNALVELRPYRSGLGGTTRPLYLNGVTGEVVETMPSAGAAVSTYQTMIDLHTGLFAGPVLRWLYFLSGVGGTVMVASGLVLWTVKRRAKLPDPARPHFGFRLVERLNIGVIAGSCAGIAVYFLANRLLPIGMAHRAEWEINSLFIAWGGVFVWTLARPARRAWIEALAGCAALYALVPLVNALTTARGLIPSLIARDWVFVGFDGVMLAMAAAYAFTAWRVATHKAKALPRRKMRMAVEAAA